MTTRTALLIPLALTGTMLLTGCQLPSNQAQPATEQIGPTGASVATMTSTRTVTAEPQPAVTHTETKTNTVTETKTETTTRTHTSTATRTKTETATSTVTEHPEPVTTTVTEEATEPEPVVQPTSSPSSPAEQTPTQPAPSATTSTTSATEPTSTPTRAVRATVARSLADLGITGSKRVALTFDDGPGASTPQVLDVLTKHQVPATFFVVGDYTRTSSGQQLLRRTADSPLFTVGGHSMHHQQMTTLSLADYTQDLQQTSSLIEQATGRAPVCMRPPYGATDAARVGRTAELGQRTVNWDVDPVDWEGPSADTITQRVLDQVHAGGSIVLLHDGGAGRQDTVQALPQIITALRAQGYEFVALPC